MKLPFILFLDIDQTTIGDLHMCLKEYKILGMIPNQKPSKMIDLQHELSSGLLRPFIKDFLAFCQKKFNQHFELFFYTNSSYEWASCIVPQIEKALGFKANRPIFTRENSLNYTKTIVNIFPLIQKSLIKKYPLIANETHIKTIFNERMIFIDDLKENLYDYPSRQIVCPEYAFKPYYSIPEKIIEKYKLPASVFDDQNILSYMDTYDIAIHNANGSVHQQNEEYCMLMHLYQTTRVEILNTKYKKDTVFLDMITAFEKIDVFTDKEIQKINNRFALSHT